MISVQKQKQIFALRARKCTVGQISETVGVSSEKVRCILQCGRIRVFAKILGTDPLQPLVQVVPYKCEGCGYRVVYDPCQICLARKRRKRSRVLSGKE